jgi:hypothetical protein
MIFKTGLFGQSLGLGNYYQGGFIVYLDINNKQGLIVSPTDLTGSQCAWEQQPYQTVTTTNTYGSGQTNTNNIVALPSITPAADLCDAYVNDGYSDWFLPNTNELYKVFQAYYDGFLGNANLRGFRASPGVKPFPYWTSYSVNFNTAQFVDFAYPSDYLGQIGNGFRDTGPSSPGPGCWVRACRYITFYN